MVQPTNFSLNAINPLTASAQGIQTGQLINQARIAEETRVQQQAAQQALQADITELNSLDNISHKDIAKFTFKHPQLSKQYEKGFEILGEGRKDALVKTGSQVYAALTADQPEIAQKLLSDQADAQRKSGMEAEAKQSETMAKLIELNPKTALVSTATMLASAMGAEKFTDTFTKLGDERRSEAKALLKGGEAGKSEVQRSEILPDGTVQLVRKDGAIEIVPAAQADKEIVKQARITGAKLQGLRAGEREEAKSASKSALKAFGSLSGIRKNVANLDRAIKLIDDGAGTGRIEKMFPSFKSASVKLGQVRKELGLDVVGAVTFGALSEGELELALDVALPDALNEQELKQWLIDKKSAQRKVSANLEEAAIYLGTPGNNIAGFITSKKGQQNDAQDDASNAPALPAGWKARVK